MSEEGCGGSCRPSPESGMPGKRSPGIPARGFFNTKLEDIAEVCPFGAKLSAARREKCCGGRAGTGLGGRVLPRNPVLAVASFPETGCRPAPPFGADLQDCRSRTVRVGAACPFRAPSVPRRGGRGTDGEQTGNRRGTDGDGRRRRFPDGTAQRRFRRGSCRAAGSVSQRSGAKIPSRCMRFCLFPIPFYTSLSGIPSFLTEKSWWRERACSFRNNRVSICSRAFPCPDMCVPISARRRRCRIIKRFLYNIRCALPRFPILRLPFDSRSPPFR